jgi:uncharacterized protein
MRSTDTDPEKTMITDYTYRPRLYFTLTFAATFALWLAGAYVSHRDDLRGLYMPLMLPGLMTPFLVSLIMVYSSGNARLKRDFVNRLTNLRLIRVRMLPALLLLMPAVVLFSIVLSLPLGQSASQFRLADGFSFSGFAPALVILMLAALFEELGWRGYAFDSLQSRSGYLKATLLFGVLWSLWHLPLVLVKDSYQYEICRQSVWFGLNFFLGIIPMGIIISWFCAKNGKSIAAAVLFHFIINISQEMLEVTQVTKSIETVVLAVVAVGLIMSDRQLFGSRIPVLAGVSR